MMLNFEQYLAERTGSSAGQQTKRKVNIEELKQMIANKDSSIANVDVSEITSMSALFKNSDFGGSWTADLSEWDTSKVEDMSWMFEGCKELTKVELPHTEKVVNMGSMFDGCTSLKEVSLPHTENVTYMGWMFYGCEKLIKVELSSIENVVDMSSMFKYCEKLEQNFSSWDISKVNYTANMFKGCTKMEDAYKDGKIYYPIGYEQ